MNERPPVPYKVPKIDSKLEEKLENGCYTIPLPTFKKSELLIDGKKACNTIQLRCHSLLMKYPDTICECNSTVKTIVGSGLGDQTEIIECGKCRTSYLIRQSYDAEGRLKVAASVWDTGRNLRPFTYRKTDEDGNFIMRINK